MTRMKRRHMCRGGGKRSEKLPNVRVSITLFMKKYLAKPAYVSEG